MIRRLKAQHGGDCFEALRNGCLIISNWKPELPPDRIVITNREHRWVVCPQRFEGCDSDFCNGIEQRGIARFAFCGFDVQVLVDELFERYKLAVGDKHGRKMGLRRTVVTYVQELNLLRPPSQALKSKLETGLANKL